MSQPFRVHILYHVNINYLATVAGWLLSEYWKCSFNGVWRVWFVASSWLHACSEAMWKATVQQLA